MTFQAKTMDAAAPISTSELHDIERLAIELATLAGAEIVTSLGGILAVRYKTESIEENIWRDPVSEVDHRVETLIRTRLAERYPEHDIIGEEIDERPGRDHEFVWAVDPIDGTANFVNGFPLFAASIGVLRAGRPVAGAIWCSTSHSLRAGVYHARAGGTLCFDHETIMPKANSAVRRRLIGMPDASADDGPWDVRKTGSAAIECAFVAAGLLHAAHFEHPHIWDVAAGIALVHASGGEVRMHSEEGWSRMERFEPLSHGGDGTPDLRNWRRPLIIGRPEAVAVLAAAR
jgi:myo-inositol-1(or 4)-monophosphatase